MKTDDRIDAYIERQADFARPVLRHLRQMVRSECGDVEETLKWGMPAFVYKGSILATMAAFKVHAAFGFWRGDVVGPQAKLEGAMGQFGRIRSLEDLPQPDVLRSYIRKAVDLVEAGVAEPRPRVEKAPPELAEDFAAALAENQTASGWFASFSRSARRDYVDWITSAKRQETRARRIVEAVGWIAEGKKRNWKYERS